MMRPAWVDPSWYGMNLAPWAITLIGLRTGAPLLENLTKAPVGHCTSDHRDSARLGPVRGRHVGLPCECLLVAAAAWEACAQWQHATGVRRATALMGQQAVLATPEGTVAVIDAELGGVSDPAREELAIVTRASPHSITNRIGVARELAEHPELLDLAEHGACAFWVVRAAIADVRHYPLPEAQRITQTLADRVNRRLRTDLIPWDAADIRRLTKRLVLSLAPKIRHKARQAAKCSRGVKLLPGENGMATLIADLEHTKAHRIFRRLTAVAGSLDAQGDARSLDQKRADVLADQLIHTPYAARAGNNHVGGTNGSNPRPSSGNDPDPYRGTTDNNPGPRNGTTHSDPAPCSAANDSNPRPSSGNDPDPYRGTTDNNPGPCNGSTHGSCSSEADTAGTANDTASTTGSQIPCYTEVPSSHSGATPVASTASTPNTTDPAGAASTPNTTDPAGTTRPAPTDCTCARNPDAAANRLPSSAAQPASPAATTEVQVVVSLATLLALDDAPGELAGVGPIPAETARELAADGQWRAWVTDATGAVTATGVNRYRPTAALARLVRAREPYCRMPGCQVAATRCDLDHTQPWPQGATTAENLGPLCRRHHNLKTHHGWSLANQGQTPPSGEFESGNPRANPAPESPPDRNAETPTSTPAPEPPTKRKPETSRNTNPRAGAGPAKLVWIWTTPTGKTLRQSQEPALHRP
ncbi:MAG: hypothetical protein K0U64_02965 [Actinomycetia bacterium]|nr:hypothetical protein [Actinomycetes bacterium]